MESFKDGVFKAVRWINKKKFPIVVPLEKTEPVMFKRIGDSKFFYNVPYILDSYFEKLPRKLERYARKSPTMTFSFFIWKNRTAQEIGVRPYPDRDHSYFDYRMEFLCEYFKSQEHFLIGMLSKHVVAINTDILNQYSEYHKRKFDGMSFQIQNIIDDFNKPSL